MASGAAALVARIIDRIEGRPYRTGRPPLPTIEVVETLRFFVREGVQWRELRATAGRACGSTLRRRLDDWSATALLRRVHVALVRMVCAGPEPACWDVVVDSCSVRAKRGGELTGPNPTDRGKPGTKYHVVVSTDGIPLGVVPSPPTSTTRGSSLTCCAWPWPSAPRSAGSTPTRPEPALRPAEPDRGDSADNRGLCAREGIRPLIREVGQPHGSGLGSVRCVVEHDCAWLLANKRLDRRHHRLGRMILALLTTACIFVIANRLIPAVGSPDGCPALGLMEGAGPSRVTEAGMTGSRRGGSRGPLAALIGPSGPPTMVVAASGASLLRPVVSTARRPRIPRAPIATPTESHAQAQARPGRPRLLGAGLGGGDPARRGRGGGRGLRRPRARGAGGATAADRGPGGAVLRELGRGAGRYWRRGGARHAADRPPLPGRARGAPGRQARHRREAVHAHPR